MCLSIYLYLSFKFHIKLLHLISNIVSCLYLVYFQFASLISYKCFLNQSINLFTWRKNSKIHPPILSLLALSCNWPWSPGRSGEAAKYRLSFVCEFSGNECIVNFSKIFANLFLSLSILETHLILRKWPQMWAVQARKGGVLSLFVFFVY